MKYLIVDIGCIECGDETRHQGLVDLPPDGVPVLQPGDGLVVTYDASIVAFAIPGAPE